MIPINAKIAGLTTKHSFQTGRVTYLLEVVILGRKFSLPVDEEFVARLDQTLEPEQVSEMPPSSASEVPQEYAFGSVERDPEDYSYEEISQL